MTEPLIILRTAEDVDKAPVGTIVCNRTSPYETLVFGINAHETLVEALPLHVLRWGKTQYPDSFTAPKLPTLADMTVQEREECMFMQAQDGGGNLCIILYNSSGSASVLYEDGSYGPWSLESVTPRPDLPRLEWPSHEPEPEFSVGKMLETVEDFQNAPIGTVAIDADGDIIRREDEASWWVPSDPPTQDADDIHYWCSRPAKIITILG
ncbi:hypothetical protein ACQX22_08970 [Corynebacterium diphtheriae]